jgi:hypothetical protein
MAQPPFAAAPGRRPLPRFLAKIGIVVPVLPDDQDIEETADDDEVSSVASSVTIDSTVVSETDSDASVDEADFSKEWMQTIEAATDVSEDYWRSLLLLLRTQRNHFPPTIPPPSPPSKARNSRKQLPRMRSQQATGISIQNAFQALAISDVESEEEQETDADLPTERAPSASAGVQCRYLKVMIKVNISDVKRRDAEALFQQKCWLQAADLFEAAHSQLHLVVVSFLPFSRALSSAGFSVARFTYIPDLSRFVTTIGGLLLLNIPMLLLWKLPPLMMLHFCLKSSGMLSPYITVAIVITCLCPQAHLH